MKTSQIRKRNRLTFNLIAEDYYQKRQAPWIECATPFKELPSASVILDAGAGSGRQSMALAEMKFNIIALDFAPKMLRLLREGAREVQLEERISAVVADIVALPFKEEAFDGVEFVAALHNIPTRRLRAAAVREIYRIARKGGLLVLTVWLRRQSSFYRTLIRAIPKVFLRKSEWGDIWRKWNDQPRFYHLYSRRELERVVSMVGFHVDRIEAKRFGKEEAKSPTRNLVLMARKI